MPTPRELTSWTGAAAVLGSAARPPSRAFVVVPCEAWAAHGRCVEQVCASLLEKGSRPLEGGTWMEAW